MLRGFKKSRICIRSKFDLFLNIFDRKQEELLKRFQKTVGFLRKTKENKNLFDSGEIADYFIDEIEKYRKDKIRQEKLGEMYQDFERKREDLLRNLELKDEKILKTKHNKSLEMVFFLNKNLFFGKFIKIY